MLGWNSVMKTLELLTLPCAVELNYRFSSLSISGMPDGTSSILSKICVNWRDVAISIKTVFSDLKSVSNPLALHWEIIATFQKLNLVPPLTSHYLS